MVEERHHSSVGSASESTHTPCHPVPRPHYPLTAVAAAAAVVVVVAGGSGAGELRAPVPARGVGRASPVGATKTILIDIGSLWWTVLVILLILIRVTGT